jgi:hypothetical protein
MIYPAFTRLQFDANHREVKTMNFRPWTIDEVPVGEVLRHATEKRTRAMIVLVTDGEATNEGPHTPTPDFVVKLGNGEFYNPNQLLGWWNRLDGSPCGKPNEP